MAAILQSPGISVAPGERENQESGNMKTDPVFGYSFAVCL